MASLIALARTPGPQKYVCCHSRLAIRPPRRSITNGTYADVGLELRTGAGEVLAALDGLAHAGVDALPVRTAEHGASTEERERVVLGARIVDGDVPEHVLVDLLREVDVDAQEVG